MAGPFTTIETKVKAQITAGSLAAAAAWLLGHYVYHDQLPDTMRQLIDVGAPVVFGAISGYLAPHTPRPAATVTGPKTLADPAVPGDTPTTTKE